MGGTEPSLSLASGQQGCTGTCCSKNAFSFLLQTLIQQQRWLRQTLCLFPWARGRYVLTSPVFRLSLCAGREQGEGQSPSSGARRAAQRAVRQGRAQQTGTPVLCCGNVAPACSDTSWVFFIRLFTAPQASCALLLAAIP